MAKQLKKWQGWALFGGSMIVVFLLGLLVSSLMERRAEVVSVFNNDAINEELDRMKTLFDYKSSSYTRTKGQKNSSSVEDDMNIMRNLSKN